MRCISALTLLAILPVVQSAGSQDTTPPHHHDSAAVIDGADHPELISDLTAYRLYLLASSEPASPGDEQVKRQAARLNEIGLADADRQVLIAISAKFNSDYQSLINKYNQAATAAWDRQERTDVKPLLADRDNLVLSTRDAIRVALTPDGWARFDAHVQGEKIRMKISAQGVNP